MLFTIMDTAISGWEALLYMLIPIGIAICTGGAVLLFSGLGNDRSKRVLAYIMLFWSIVYWTMAAALVTGGTDYADADVMAPRIIIGGNLYLIILLLYPLEMLNHDWVNMKRCLMLMSPFMALTGIYYVGMHIAGETPLMLYTWSDFIENIWYFNVWYRLVMLSSVLFYLIFLLYIIYRYEEGVTRSGSFDRNSDGSVCISWLLYYGAGVILICGAYFFAVLDGSLYCHVVYNIIVQIFLCCILYKSFFYENRYARSFSRNPLNNATAQGEPTEPELPDITTTGQETKTYEKLS